MKEMGLGYAPLKDKATQMGIEHLMEFLNRPTDREYLAHAHASRVATNYQHWPKEAYEANQAKLPTRRVLSYIQHIAGEELEHIPSLQASSHIATNMRAVSKEIDENRASRREYIPANLPPKDYAKQLRNQCQPLNYSDRILKRLAPLWKEGVSDWTPIIEKQTTPEGSTYIYMLNAKTIHAKLQSGDEQRPNNSLETALTTLRTTLTLPTVQEHRKLQKNPQHPDPKKYTRHGTNT
jgi:hypothetical protein